MRRERDDLAGVVGDDDLVLASVAEVQPLVDAVNDCVVRLRDRDGPGGVG
ncbi:hypothetical protein [Streptomyces sp. NPDC059743]